MRLTRNAAALVLTTLTIVPSRADLPCPDGIFRDDCANPRYEVAFLPLGSGTVDFTPGGNITIFVADDRTKTVRITTPIPGSLGVVTISRANTNFNLDLQIGDADEPVGSVGMIVVNTNNNPNFSVDLNGNILNLGTPPYPILNLGSIGRLEGGLTLRGDLLSSIDLSQGAYNRVQVGQLTILGNMLGSIEARRGTINVIQGSIPGTRFGDATNPIAIRAWGDINEITAPEINSFIQAGVNFGAGRTPANIKSVLADNSLGTGNYTGGMLADGIGEPRVALGGDDGKMLTRSLNPGIQVKGDFGAPGAPTQIYIREGVEIINQGGNYIRPVVIGGKIRYSNASVGVPEIFLPANGLVGQIIVGNNGLLAQPSDGWEAGATAQIGTYQLTSASYSTLPGILGGGAIGVARFSLHGAACAPYQDAVVYTGPSPAELGVDPDCLGFNPSIYGPTQAFVQHYGPVQFSGVPLIVQRRPNYASPWEDISDNFNMSITSAFGAQASLQDSRVAVTGKILDGPNNTHYQYRFSGSFEYRILPRPGVLKSRGVAGSPDVAEYEYRFKVLYRCTDGLLGAYDLNGDHDLNAGDLNAWMSGPADFNADGAANTTDLGNLVRAMLLYQNLSQ